MPAFSAPHAALSLEHMLLHPVRVIIAVIISADATRDTFFILFSFGLVIWDEDHISGQSRKFIAIHKIFDCCVSRIFCLEANFLEIM